MHDDLAPARRKAFVAASPSPDGDLLEAGRLDAKPGATGSTMSANEFMDREEPNLGKGSGFPQSEEIRQMLQGVAGLIADADRRQGDALRELKERLESLGRAAQSAKSRVPDEFADAVTRIEDGLALLADRIAEAETERSVARATHDDVDAFGPLLPAMTAAAAGVEASLDEAPAVAPHDTEPTANSDGYASASDGPAPLRSALSTSTDSDTPSFRQPKLVAKASVS